MKTYNESGYDEGYNFIPMSNRVKLHDAYVELLYIGDQTYETVRSMVDEALALTSSWTDKPLLVLADLNKLGKSTFGSREASWEALKLVPYSRVAICAGNTFIRHLAQLVSQAAGMADKIQVFASREEAVDWLTDQNVVKSSKKAPVRNGKKNK